MDPADQNGLEFVNIPICAVDVMPECLLLGRFLLQDGGGGGPGHQGDGLQGDGDLPHQGCQRAQVPRQVGQGVPPHTRLCAQLHHCRAADAQVFVSYWVSVPHWSRWGPPDPTVYLNAGPVTIRGSTIRREVKI